MFLRVEYLDLSMKAQSMKCIFNCELHRRVYNAINDYSISRCNKCAISGSTISDLPLFPGQFLIVQ